MGYQVVGIPQDPYPIHVVVLNAKMVVEQTPERRLVFERGARTPGDRIARALESPLGSVRIRVLTRTEAVSAGVLESRGETGTGPASSAPITSSEQDEEFLRFSAFADDVRILADGSVVAGTYVTTRVDGMAHVKTGMNAVRRYALPNPDPAIHRFHLKPPVQIRIQRGTTQPAFGQPGGGVEVIFVSGSPAKTKRMQDTLPPGT